MGGGKDPGYCRIWRGTVLAPLEVFNGRTGGKWQRWEKDGVGRREDKE